MLLTKEIKEKTKKAIEQNFKYCMYFNQEGKVAIEDLSKFEHFSIDYPIFVYFSTYGPWTRPAVGNIIGFNELMEL